MSSNSKCSNRGNGEEPHGPLNENLVDRPRPSLLENLPLELLYHIFSCMPKIYVANTMGTCQYLCARTKPYLYDAEARSSNFVLGWAAYKGLMNIVEYIVKLEIDVNRELDCSFIPTIGGNVLRSTPLLLATMNGNADIFFFLIKKGANMRAVDSDNNHALCYCRVDPTITRALLEAGLDANELGALGTSPLMLILDVDGPRLKQRAPKPSLLAVKELLVNGHADPNFLLRAHMTPLCYATENGPEMVKLLLEHGADPNGRGDLSSDHTYATTPLEYAAGIEDAFEVVEVLVKSGALMNVRSNGNTPLLTAIRERESKTVDVLLENGADPDYYYFESSDDESSPLSFDFNDIRSPLTVAAGRQDWALFKQLIEAGADINHIIVNPLIYAAKYCPPAVTKELLDRGADPNIFPKNGGPAYNTALLRRYRNYSGNTSSDSGSDSDNYGRGYSRDLYSAGVDEYNHDYDIIMDLHVQHGVRLHSRRLGAIFSPLFLAFTHCSLDGFARVVRDGANINACVHYKGIHRYTLLHHALFNAGRFVNARTVKLLLDNGADPLAGYSRAADMGKTPLGSLIYRSEPLNCAWRRQTWAAAVCLLEHEKAGPKITAKFSNAMLASLLFHAITHGRPHEIVQRVRVFAKLTNHNNRWGSNGISGILNLIQENDFWFRFQIDSNVPPQSQASWRRKKLTDLRKIIRLCTDEEVVNIEDFAPQVASRRPPKTEEMSEDDWQPALDLLFLQRLDPID